MALARARSRIRAPAPARPPRPDDDEELDRLVLMTDGRLTRDGANSMLSASYGTDRAASRVAP